MLLAPAPAIAQTPIFIDSGQNLGADFSTAVALGDVDSDGDLDAVVGNHQGQVNQLWLNDGRGAFVVSAQALGSGSTTDVALGALDGDDRLDLFVVNRLAGGGAPGRVWLNRGGGEMMRTTAVYGEGLPANDVALADFDGDGFLDAFVANGAFYNYQPNLIWFGDGRGGFVDSGLRLANPERATSEAVAVGDLEGDGHLDAFAVNDTANTDDLWLYAGDRSFTNVPVEAGAFATDVALGDLDGDGDLDAFVTNRDFQANRELINTQSNEAAPIPTCARPMFLRRVGLRPLATVPADGRQGVVQRSP